MSKIEIMTTVLFLLMAVCLFAEDKTNEMIKVPGGTFLAGTQMVTVSSFSISKFIITQAEWKAIMGNNPSFIISLNDPVENVSWYDVIVYCNKRSIKEGLTSVYSINGSADTSAWGAVPRSENSNWDAVSADWEADGYRLPTEMEWIWAAIGADTESPGQINTNGYSKAFAGSTGKNKIEDYAWVGGNGNKTTHTVGSKLPNELGLYDMSGGVWQWCWDLNVKEIHLWYPGESLANYRGGSSGVLRVKHSGSFDYDPTGAAVAYRWYAYRLCENSA